MMNRFFKVLVLLLVAAAPCFAQSQSGILVGAGLGFESLSRNLNHPDYIVDRVQFHSNYKYNVQLGYRFRFESAKNDRLFFDVDPLLKLQTFRNTKFYPSLNDDIYRVSHVSAPDVNFQLALSPSVNYKLFKGLYAGIGVEPTWNMVTEGKHFDIPVFGRLGYNINGIIEFAVTYRQGFLNVIDDKAFTKGRTSDLNIGIYIPLWRK